MAKYSIVELSIRNGCLLNTDRLNSKETEGLQHTGAIYIYRGTISRKVYIGQTIHFMDRHKQHFSGTEEKFNTADFDKVLVIFSKLFNGSSLDDVESQLITYFTADNCRKSEQISFDHDEVINQTGGNSVAEYAGRENIASEVILPVWEKELYTRGWVSTPTLEELKTRELVKYSPIKTLTSEQGQLITEIINNPSRSYVINGDAGTGKTVLLTHLVASMLKDRPGARIGVVVQPNWEKTAESIFRVYGMNSSYLSVKTSTGIITDNSKYDVIIIDESHKLSRKYGKQHPSFGKVYEIPKFSNCQSHLEILQRMGQQIILMYDVLQAIRPANITGDRKRIVDCLFHVKNVKMEEI